VASSVQVRVALAWVGIGAAGAFLLAAVISVALGGPGWPYYLVLGGVAVLAALFAGLRRPAEDSRGT
jgi:hypothetical protein